MDTLALVREAAIRHGVDPDLAVRVARQESRGNQGAVSPKGAIGVMQLMPGTARDLGVDPNDTRQNIDGGVRYLKQQLDAFGRPDLALAAYNAGPGAVRKYGGVPPYAETQAYVRKISGGQGVQEFDGASIFGMGGAGPGAGAPAAADFDGSEIFASPAEWQEVARGDKGVSIEVERPRSPAAARPPQQERISPVSDFVQSVPAGVRQTMAQTADTIMSFSPLGMFGRVRPGNVMGLPSLTAPVGDLISRVSGQGDYKPKTNAGRAGQTLGQFAPAAVLPGTAVERAKNVLMPFAGAEGAAGVVRAFGGGEDAQDVARAVGGVAGGVASGVKINKPQPKPKPKSVEALRTEKTAAYDAVEASGFKFPRQDVKALAGEIRAEIRAKGGPKAAKLYPDADAMAAQLDALANQKDGVPLTQLDRLRSDIYDTLVEPGGKESAVGRMMRQKIDALIEAANAPGIKEARAANMRFRKAEDITKRIESARLQAGRANSGENLGNAIRQKVSPTVDPLHSAQIENFTPQEAEAARRVVMGDPLQNALRTWGNRLRNPMWTGTATTPAALLGFAGGGPLGGAGAAGLTAAGMQGAGQGLRKAAEARTIKNVDELLALIAAGGELPKRPPLLSYTGDPNGLGLAIPMTLLPGVAAAKTRKRSKAGRGGPKPRQVGDKR